MNFFDLLAPPPRKVVPAPPPPLLSEQVQNELVRMGLSKFRRSHFDMGRQCPKKLKLSASQDNGSFGIYYLLGSLFALMVLDPEEARSLARVPSYYLRKFHELREVDPDTKYHLQGTPINHGMLKQLAGLFSERDTLGLPLGEVVARTCEAITQGGVKVISTERPLPLQVGKVLIHGTVDVEGMMGNLRGKIDMKSYGLWSPYLTEITGRKLASIKGTSFSDEQIRWHPQLRFYAWLDWKLHGTHTDFFGLVFPANLLPYKDQKRAGELRGRVMQITMAPPSAFHQEFEDDFVNFLRLFTSPGGQYRSLPGEFGKSACPACPYFKPCLSGLQSLGSTGNEQLASDPALAYLQEEEE